MDGYTDHRDFAASPRARLDFFYRRSPYWDTHKNHNPIARSVKLELEPL